MSKRAEEAGLRAYPRAPFGPQNITDDDCNRQVYIRGYEQAEKDFALTLEDVRTILDKENDILHECNDNALQVIEVYPKGEDYYGEILKRFNEQRKI